MNQPHTKLPLTGDRVDVDVGFSDVDPANYSPEAIPRLLR